ncbi:putative aspartic peptidase domain superfamily [Helianthus anomalus]
MQGGIFGCGIPDDENFMYDGVVGFCRWLRSQTRPSSHIVWVLDLTQKQAAFLLTGSEASNYYDSDVQTTPLVTDASNYYITLEGISVGKAKLDVQTTPSCT